MEHTFPVPPDQTFPNICKLENSGEKWLIPDVGNNKIYLYNLDYSLFKEIIVPPQPNQYFWIMYVSDKLFDLDASIEYMLTDFYQTRVTIYKEDGSILLSEGDSSYTANIATSIGPIFNTAAGTKMGIALKSVATGETSCKIYRLPGKLNSIQPEPETTNLERCITRAYPNPNDGHTRIEYHLLPGETDGQIIFYNLQGNMVKSFKVEGQSGYIEIDNTNLSSGTYLYQIVAGTNSSSMKKMILIK